MWVGPLLKRLFSKTIFLPFLVMGESPKTFGNFFRRLSVTQNGRNMALLKIGRKHKEQIGNFDY